jgi:hypothetical protein
MKKAKFVKTGNHRNNNENNNGNNESFKEIVLKNYSNFLITENNEQFNLIVWIENHLNRAVNKGTIEIDISDTVDLSDMIINCIDKNNNEYVTDVKDKVKEFFKKNLIEVQFTENCLHNAVSRVFRAIFVKQRYEVKGIDCYISIEGLKDIYGLKENIKKYANEKKFFNGVKSKQKDKNIDIVTEFFKFKFCKE